MTVLIIEGEKTARKNRQNFTSVTSLPNDDPRDNLGPDETLILDHHLKDVNPEKAGDHTLGLMIHALKGRMQC